MIDVDALKRHTVCRNGLTLSHPLVKALFRALESFSSEERQLFLRFELPFRLDTTAVVLDVWADFRFVWGRNRLPSSDSDWTQPFTINLLSSLSSGEFTQHVDSEAFALCTFLGYVCLQASSRVMKCSQCRIRASSVWICPLTLVTK